MLRTQPNEKETFSASLAAAARETEAAVKQRRREMDQAWDGVDDGWKKLEKRMAEVGITRPSGLGEGMVRLNVGGAHVNVPRSVLERERGSFSAQAWTLGNLFEAQWDARVPRDADGRIVLDESPVCVKHLVHALFTGTRDFEVGVLADEKPYLPYVARALGLSPIGMSVEGGSAILGPGETGPLTAALRGWCPGEPAGLKLLYRASRDGWNAPTFHAKCDSSPFTIYLVQVAGGGVRSIAGGYSSVSWACSTDSFKPSPGAFVFMLKDGSESARRAFQPMKWGVKPTQADKAVFKGPKIAPCFGNNNLWVNLDSREMKAKNTTYDIPPESAFLKLHGQAASEVEVFQVCPQALAVPQPEATTEAAATAALWTTQEETNKAALLPVQSNDDTHSFGASVADSLVEERMALRLVEDELSRARTRTAACAASLAAVYGPEVAAGEEDPVVELSVRGSRMTTLRSTLRACPDSALAARFDDERWPAAEKDLDEHGRRKIDDCSPAVFSKVLDVLRMTKRAGWRRRRSGDGSEEESSEGGQEEATVRVAVKASDRVSFDEFVHMHFPGCESFVADHVDFLEESNVSA